MPISIANGNVLAGGTSIPLADFPQLHAHHLNEVAGTRQLELAGFALSKHEFAFAALEPFIRQVCRWGNYAGIAGRILKRNTPQELMSRFAGTTAGFMGARPAATALVSLNYLSGLGTPSFASKHLRFIRPDICPVLDRLLSRDLGYCFTPPGYQQFSTDCCAVAHQLDIAGFALPPTNRWGAADVEMSIFARLYFK
jgi:hypothetical protein